MQGTFKGYKSPNWQIQYLQLTGNNSSLKLNAKKISCMKGYLSKNHTMHGLTFCGSNTVRHSFYKTQDLKSNINDPLEYYQNA